MYKAFGLCGHTLDLVIYASVTMGGPLLWLVRDGLHPIQLLVLLVVVASLSTFDGTSDESSTISIDTAPTRRRARVIPGAD